MKVLPNTTPYLIAYNTTIPDDIYYSAYIIIIMVLLGYFFEFLNTYI